MTASTDNRSWSARIDDDNAKHAEQAADEAEARATASPEDAKLAAKATKARGKASKLRARADESARDDAAKQKAKSQKQATKIAQADEAQRQAAEWQAQKANLVFKYGSLYVFPNTVTNWPMLGQREDRPLAGVSARVEESGQLSSRSTLTRSLVPGMHGWQKKMDDRELWLVVDGPDFQWTIPAGQPGIGEKQVRQLAAKLTGMGRGAAATAATPVEPPKNENGMADQLCSLAELHASGALTDAEFAAAKARLLG